METDEVSIVTDGLMSLNCRVSVILLRLVMATAALLLLGSSCRRESHTDAFRVGLVTPGSISDEAWNSGAYQGLIRIQDSLGAAVSHVEARTPAEQEEALRTYATQKFDLVFGHGFEFQGSSERVSAQYPKTVFIVTSGERVAGNVSPSSFASRRPVISRG